MGPDTGSDQREAQSSGFERAMLRLALEQAQHARAAGKVQSSNAVARLS